MTLPYAVLWIDHQNAQVLQFDDAHVQSQRVHTHTHHTRQGHSKVRTEHEFFADVCTALGAIPQVLVVGSKTAQADFKHYVEKHRPALVKQIVGYESVDRETERELVAMARKRFLPKDVHGKGTKV
jgi:stalled ribosome rescue protein Dom34